MSKVIVVGGGAAGMMAAIVAGRNGHKVTLYEKNEKLGKKLYITGKGRCNITNASDLDVIFDNMMSNKKFLYSSFYTFTNENTMDFFEELGLPIKVERGNRVFPVSDKSSDVIQTLAKELARQNVEVLFGHKVESVLCEENHVVGLKVNGRKIDCDAVIVATGGLSYPFTGATGDGYEFAKSLGHTIKDCSPSLVPMNIKENFVKELQGLSLKNVEVRILDDKKELYRNFGEMMFTHFGVTGPLILSGSSYVAAYKKRTNLKLIIDLKPALSVEQLDQRLLRDFEANLNKQFGNVLDQLLPKKMIPIMIQYCNIPKEKKVNLITKEERRCLLEAIKGFTLTMDSLRGYNEAVITKGGVKVNEVNPATMESKKMPGVYFAGEVLDLDALTGGFNLQIAWSTAYLAGLSIE